MSSKPSIIVFVFFTMQILAQGEKRHHSKWGKSSDSHGKTIAIASEDAGTEELKEGIEANEQEEESKEEMKAEELKEPKKAHDSDIEKEPEQEEQKALPGTKRKVLFSLGFSSGLSYVDEIVGKNQQNNKALSELKFSQGGLGIALAPFFEIGFFDSFFIQLELLSRLATGIHVKNENRLWYSLFLFISAGLSAKYQFQISTDKFIFRPFIGGGGAFSGHGIKIRNTRETDKESYEVYDFSMLPTYMWYVFLGHRFMRSHGAFLDLSFRLSRYLYVDATRDTSGAADLGGDFEIDEKANIEISSNSSLRTKPFNVYDIFLTWGWSL